MIMLLKLTVCLFAVSVGQVQGVITDNYGNTVADDGTISWAPLPTGNKSYVTNSSYSDDGLGMLFAFARNFINTVQPNDFPFGKLMVKFVQRIHFHIQPMFTHLHKPMETL